MGRFVPESRAALLRTIANLHDRRPGDPGYGPRLRLELTRRGVPREIVTDIVADISASYAEEETLAALVARKFAGFDPQAASDRDTRRVVDYLQRRGFSTAAIFRFFRARDECRGDILVKR